MRERDRGAGGDDGGGEKDSDRETDVENITTPWMPCPIDPLHPSAEGPKKHGSPMD